MVPRRAIQREWFRITPCPWSGPDDYAERIISVCGLADRPSVLLPGTHRTQAPQAPLDCSSPRSGERHCTPVYCPIDPCNALSTNLIVCDRQVLYASYSGSCTREGDSALGRHCQLFPRRSDHVPQRHQGEIQLHALWWPTPSEPPVFMSNTA